MASRQEDIGGRRRRPVRSATGGQCSRNRTCDLLPKKRSTRWLPLICSVYFDRVMQSALACRTSVGGATDLRGPVRSATGGQCRWNRTCDFLLKNCRPVGCRCFAISIPIELCNRGYNAGHPSAERRIYDSATGGQCRWNRTCDLRPKSGRPVGCR